MKSFKILFVLTFCCLGFGASSPVADKEGIISDEDLSDLINQYYESHPEAKRSVHRPTFTDYLKLAALQSELENEAIANANDEESYASQGVDLPANSHPVDKRRSRYGFWVTAINKMDNNHLKGFLGNHKNVYNVYKRASAKRGVPFVHAMGNAA